MSDKPYHAHIFEVRNSHNEGICVALSTPEMNSGDRAKQIAQAVNAYGPLVAFVRKISAGCDVVELRGGQTASQLLKDIGEDTP